MTIRDAEPVACRGGEVIAGEGAAIAGRAGSEPVGEAIGLFWTWWRGDSRPALAPMPGLAIGPAGDERLMADLMGVDTSEVRERMGRGHRPWLARLAGEPVGYGWVATREAEIGELGITFALPARDRYLWDFVTAPAWRGRRIYPRLLQAMLGGEAGADRFWVGHDLPNVASARGIARAGFRMVGAVHRLRDGSFGLVRSGPVGRAVAAAALLDLPIVGGATGSGA